MPAVAAFRIGGELILSAIVVRAPADNGDGVLAGALGDLTEKVVAILLTAAHTKQSSRWQKSPGNATGAKLVHANRSVPRSMMEHGSCADRSYHELEVCDPEKLCLPASDSR